MRDEILINVTPRETRVAVVENGLLQEVHIERANRRGLVGNIYKGHVNRVLPGIQAAFIELGLERTAFLHATDIVLPGNGQGEDERQVVEDITQQVSDGQELLVQVVKDPLGSKGARLTTQLSIPSRYIVYMPQMNHIGVSQKITDEEERQRLRNAIAECTDGGGYIIRTVAEGVSIDELREDVTFVHKLWQAVQARMPEAGAGELIFEAMPVELRILRDLPALTVPEGFRHTAAASGRIFSGPEALEGFAAFAEKRQPRWVTETLG